MKLTFAIFWFFVSLSSVITQRQQLDPEFVEFLQRQDPQFKPPQLQLDNNLSQSPQLQLDDNLSQHPQQFGINENYINFIPEKQQNEILDKPQPQQENIYDFSAYKRPQDQPELPTLPPLHIPPTKPVGPAPSLQSPIRNLFSQPAVSNTFSLSSIIERFISFLNTLNSNLNRN